MDSILIYCPPLRGAAARTGRRWSSWPGRDSGCRIRLGNAPSCHVESARLFALIVNSARVQHPQIRLKLAGARGIAARTGRRWSPGSSIRRCYSSGSSPPPARWHLPLRVKLAGPREARGIAASTGRQRASGSSNRRCYGSLVTVLPTPGSRARSTWIVDSACASAPAARCFRERESKGGDSDSWEGLSSW
jgi:hypothetical protein